ncbi:chemotaxis protein MotC [Hyphomicrobium nitrativorans NL23]|uniref:Chemotaxis protein MotC n=1 Tax=Hyphomicrobium nitrativorans NL23 TaxID=1029756 RepID=V5SCN0_9HYPH|nr:chemotaxis protein MotC [Hyphomicrobium nitrativorans]AHB47780.1 chemotaxis protein MotC [Hyphomicrobium nitrativorans NL23]
MMFRAIVLAASVLTLGCSLALAADAPQDGEPDAEGAEAAAAVVPLWPELPAVEADQQPYVLIRALRSVQDEVAVGSTTAHEQQRQILRDLGSQLRGLPVQVWDDVRNVRAAVFFALSGGDPAVLKIVIGRTKTPYVERRLLRGALAYGEGRQRDALGLLHPIKARDLDPVLGGMVALIQGTLLARTNSKDAIQRLDEARLLAPGTLIEESALRQEILLVAREGEIERFDVLTDQYSRRFPNSLFAQSFRRQFFAGVARQDFKRASEWISRTQTELMKVPAGERVGLYLAIAQEATKGGNLDIAKFAAGKARELSHAGSRQMARALLYEGAARVATDEFETGVALLREVDLTALDAADREVHAAALAVSRSVGAWPEAGEEPDAEVPSSVSNAQTLLSDIDTLLGGSL